ncbi:MAG: response regulator [Propionibacteriaceae bacterium]|nr:response regulator [Propionibacteriaceae bacterium]
MNVVVIVYSHDSGVRTDVIDALGSTLGGADLVIHEVATQAALISILDAHNDIDCCILDSDATPMGGMGLSKQIRDEYEPAPPILLLIAREADSWLAAWSRAEATHLKPVDPLTLPKQVEELVFVDADEAA